MEEIDMSSTGNYSRNLEHHTPHGLGGSNPSEQETIGYYPLVRGSPSTLGSMHSYLVASSGQITETSSLEGEEEIQFINRSRNPHNKCFSNRRTG